MSESVSEKLLLASTNFYHEISKDPVPHETDLSDDEHDFSHRTWPNTGTI